METFWHWVLTIALFVVALGILVTIHELGHFSMAKLFNVYCQEFSVGFGPKLLKKKRKDGETYFSIRAIPLGGYVSMYGEGVELEEGVTVPEERSLEGIKKWKKAIILVAGITLNVVLALLLFTISNLCFPVSAISSNVKITSGSVAETAGVKTNDKIYYYGIDATETTDADKHVTFEYKKDGKTYTGSFYIVDPDVSIDGGTYVLTYTPYSAKVDNTFTGGMHLFVADSTGTIKEENEVFKRWSESGYTLPNYPNYKADMYSPIGTQSSFTADVNFLVYDESTQTHATTPTTRNIPITSGLKEGSGTEYEYKDIGLCFPVFSYWLPFGTRVQNIFIDFGNASVAVFQGIGRLFTGGIKDLSGVIGILNQSSTILSNYAFATYLYFWGLISVNLAIFNLLPFPGLDGWQLLVTAIEGISKKKVPNKVKNVVSTIGLCLLFGLMAVIVVLDILRWCGVPI